MGCGEVQPGNYDKVKSEDTPEVPTDRCFITARCHIRGGRTPAARTRRTAANWSRDASQQAVEKELTRAEAHKGANAAAEKWQKILEGTLARDSSERVRVQQTEP